MYTLQSLKPRKIFYLLPYFSTLALLTELPGPNYVCSRPYRQSTGRKKKNHSMENDLIHHQEKRRGFCGKHVSVSWQW